MSTEAELRDELKTRLVTITGLNGYDTWPESVIAPAAIVMPAGNTKQVAGGIYQSTFEITALVKLTRFDEASNALDTYLQHASGGILAALKGDTTLAGKAVGMLIPDAWQEYDPHTVKNQGYLGARLLVEVYHT